MTKQYDPKLVDVVRVALERAIGCAIDGEEATAALAAIDASGIAWVAPSALTPALAKRGAAMVLDTQMASGHPERGGTFNDFELPMAVAWRSVRDACLAERRGEGR